MKALSIAVLLALVSLPAWTEPAQKPSGADAGSSQQHIDKPTIADGDSWTFRVTKELGNSWHQTQDEWTVAHTGSADNLISVKEVGSKLPPREYLVAADWSRQRNVNGKQVVVNRPFDFPLFKGKTWEVEYSEDNPPANRQAKSTHWHIKYTVVGWQKVTVPAGTFDTVKIEADGQWTAEIATADAAVANARKDDNGSVMVLQHRKAIERTVTGKLYKAFWYLPKAKIFAKAVEETFNANGARTERETEELESTKVGG